MCWLLMGQLELNFGATAAARTSSLAMCKVASHLCKSCYFDLRPSRHHNSLGRGHTFAVASCNLQSVTLC